MRSADHDAKRQFNEILSLIDSTYLLPQLRAKPKYVWVAVSTACDLRCGFCPRQYIEPVDSGFMDLERFRAAAEQFDGMRKAALFGLGDPLLSKSFFEFVAICHARGLEVATTSNGTNLTEDVARRLIESGVEELGVSMDAATPELFRRLRAPGDFAAICRNVERFSELKRQAGSATPCLVIPCTISSENLHELPDMVNLAHRLGATGVSLSDLAAMREDFARYCVPDSPELSRRLDEAFQRGKELGLVVGRFRQKMNPWVDAAAETEGRPHGCPTLWEHFHLERRGETKYCCYIGDAIPGAFDRPMMDLLNSDCFVRLRESLIRGRLRKECRGCTNLTVNSPERVEAILREAEKRIDGAALLGETEREQLRQTVRACREVAPRVVGRPYAPPRDGLLRRLARRTLPAPLRRALRSVFQDAR
ncbi:MAG: radical SAM protein [Candidatus Sumerlaeota bacterium]|nr:radical SAM protein [Candidatus Sumerlaeota bacterium]